MTTNEGRIPDGPRHPKDRRSRHQPSRSTLSIAVAIVGTLGFVSCDHPSTTSAIVTTTVPSKATETQVGAVLAPAG